MREELQSHFYEGRVPVEYADLQIQVIVTPIFPLPPWQPKAMFNGNSFPRERIFRFAFAAIRQCAHFPICQFANLRIRRNVAAVRPFAVATGCHIGAVTTSTESAIITFIIIIIIVIIIFGCFDCCCCCCSDGSCCCCCCFGRARRIMFRSWSALGLSKFWVQFVSNARANETRRGSVLWER